MGEGTSGRHYPDRSNDTVDGSGMAGLVSQEIGREGLSRPGDDGQEVGSRLVLDDGKNRPRGEHAETSSVLGTGRNSREIGPQTCKPR